MPLSGLRPYLVGNPERDHWGDDSRWRFQHLGEGSAGRWFPEVPGEYRIELRIESLPAPDYMPWPTWEEHPIATSAIVMAGRMTDWGEEHDGMRARLVWSDGCADADTTPFAVQLQNVSDRARKYNVAGNDHRRDPAAAALHAVGRWRRVAAARAHSADDPGERAVRPAPPRARSDPS